MHRLRFRQIHLDFHTAASIPDIGESFDVKEWQAMLEMGRVDSITLFAVCHHGWSYFDTEVGKRHPNLSFDLLRSQFDAVKTIGIKAPIYLSAGVNDRVAQEHPEWREIGPDGSLSGWMQSPLSAGFKRLCLNTPYLDYLCQEIEEVVTEFPSCDGIFLDIIGPIQCCCEWCLADMLAQGYDPTVEGDRLRFAEHTQEKYYAATTAAARIDNVDMPVFHNSGHIRRGDTASLKYFSHLELESLPTGGWGYDHFPMSAKYCQNLSHDFLGMTGKFHTTWGEFGGFKHPNALRYECAAMMAYGAKCSIGDQLHPSGKLDPSTYHLIGEAYREVEAKEAWCREAAPVADVAVLSSVSLENGNPRNDPADTGACRILLEGQILFSLIDGDMDFSLFRLIILPDDIRIGTGLKTKLDAYVGSGGKLLLSGKSGVTEDDTAFLFDVGARFEGPSEYSPHFILPKEELRPFGINSPIVAYANCNLISITDGESLGDIFEPYFNRDYRHFCSHQHAPNKMLPSGFACGVRKDGLVYLGQPIFRIYAAYGAVAYKDYVLKIIRALLGKESRLVSNLPSTARLSLNRQPIESRYVLHLLYAPTVNRGGYSDPSSGPTSMQMKCIEVIEDLIPLHDTKLTLRVPERIKSVRLEPQGIELSFTIHDDEVGFTVPSFDCHQIIACTY